jgi:acyl carrier protein/lipid II:glycine glycyltransferase (peptidoglycan interpeptide bridge formation enzyme)
VISLTTSYLPPDSALSASPPQGTSHYSIQTLNDPIAWARLFQQSAYSTLMQTWAYGASIMDNTAWTPERQIVLHDNSPVALAQVLVREIPLVGSFARILHGPLFIEQPNAVLADSVSPVLQALREYWVETRHMSLSVSPCIIADDAFSRDAALASGFRESDEVVWDSIRINVSPALQTMRSKFQRSWKNNLRKAERDLVVSIGQDQRDLDEFTGKYQHFQAMRQFSWPSPQLVRSLCHYSVSHELIRISHHGDIILEVLWLQVADTALGFATYATHESRSLNAMNLALWHLIVRAKESGLRWVDLGGIDEMRLPGLSHFKRKFLVIGEEYRLPGVFEASPPSAPLSKQLLHEYDFCFGLSPSEQPRERPQRNDIATIKAMVATTLHEFLRQNADWDGPIEDDLELIASGIVDSLSILSLVAALEKKFDIKIAQQELSFNNFNTMQPIAELIAEQQTHHSLSSQNGMDDGIRHDR